MHNFTSKNTTPLINICCYFKTAQHIQNLKLILFIISLGFTSLGFGQQTVIDNSPNGNESWPVPAGVTSVTVEIWGAGGGGGGSRQTDGAEGAGGGGGGYSSKTINVSSGQTINYSIGNGGNGTRQNGNSGGSTTLSHTNSNTTLNANGGGGGNGNNDASNNGGGNGGTSTGGTTNTTGEDGGDGSYVDGTGSVGGNGGDAGNTVGTGGLGQNNSNGEDGSIPGGGGGGGEYNSNNNGNNRNRRGGHGADGQVRFTYTINLTPTILIVSPTTICEGETITITGTNLDSASAVTIGGTSASIISTNATTITTTVGAGTTGTVQVTTAGGTATSSSSVTVNTSSIAPTGITPSNPTICNNGGNVNLQIQGGSAGTGASIKWYSDSALTNQVGSGNNYNASPSTTTTYYARYEGTCNETSEVSVEVVVATLTQASQIIGNTTVCQGETNVQYEINPISNATSYVWTVPNGATITSTLPYSNIITVDYSNSAATGDITVKGVNGICTDGQARSQVITVNTLSAPPTNISVQGGNTSICSGENINLTVSGGFKGTGAEARWYTDDCFGTFVSNAESITVNPTSTTTYYVKYTGDTVCNTTDCISVTINVDQPVGNTIGAISGDNDVCQGENNITYTVPVVTNAATYTWTLPSGATPVSGTLVTNTNSITVNYSNSATSGNITVIANSELGTCGSTNQATLAVTVNDLPIAPTFDTPLIEVCNGDSETYTVTPISGVTSYNWTVPTGASITSTPTDINSITVDFSGASSGNITVDAVNTCGTGPTTTLPITVNTVPNTPGTITGPAAVCPGDTAVEYVIPALANTTSYNWTISNGSATFNGTSNTNTIALDIDAMALADFTISVVGVNECGESVTASEFTVTVNEASVAPDAITPTNGLTTICEGTSTTLNVSGGSLGTGASIEWFTDSCGGTTAGTGNDITVSPIVTTTYYARYTGTCNVTTCTSITITVDPLPLAAGIITGSDAVCQADSNVEYTVPTIDHATTYIWTLPTGATIVSGDGTNTITVNYSNTAVSGGITVQGENTCGTGQVSAPLNINVNTVPATPDTITGITPVCPGETMVEYSIPALTNTTSYAWSISNSSATFNGTSDSNIVFIDIDAGAVEDFIISVVGINECGQSVTASEFEVIINKESTAPTLITSSSGSLTICEGTSTILTASGGTLGTGASESTIEWFTDSCGGTSAGTGNDLVVNPIVTTTYFARYVGTCNTTTCASVTITVDPLPLEADTISGQDEVCQGQTAVTYTVPTIDYATNYLWTLPTGATIVSGNGTNSILVDFNVTATSGNITVQGQNACGTGTVSANFPVTVNITPFIPTNYTPLACSGQEVTVSPSNSGGNIVPAGTTYSWSIPAVLNGVTGATGETGQTNFNQTLINQTGFSQTVIYEVTAQTGGCSASVFTVIVTINPQPIVTGTPLTQTVCPGENATITFSETTGITGAIDYIWTRNNTANVTGAANGGNSNAISTTFNNTTGTAQTTTYTVTAISENGCESEEFTVDVIVNPTPTILATPSTQTICSEEDITAIVLTNPNSVPGTVTYSWTRDNENITGIADSSGNTISGQLINTTNTPQSTTFTITAVANGCAATTTTATVTVNPKPTLTVNLPSQEVCGSSPIADIIASSNLSGTSYTWSRNETTDLTGIAASGSGSTITGTFINNTNTVQSTTITFTGTTGSGCTETITAEVIVKPTPIIVATPNRTTICDDDDTNDVFSIALSTSNNIALDNSDYTWTRDKTTEVTGIANSGSGSPISSGSLNNTTTETQTVTFTITATKDGCSTETTVSVDVYAPLLTPIISDNQSVCLLANPAPLTITNPNLGGSESYTYQWQRSNNGTNGWGNIAGANSNTYQPPLIPLFGSQNYYYRLILTDSCGTKTSNTVFIQVIDNAGFDFDIEGIPNGTQCPGEEFTVSISSVHASSSSVRYIWEADTDYINPATGGPNGNTGGSFFFGLFRTSTGSAGPLTVQNNTNETVITQLKITPRVYSYAGNNPSESDFICSISPQLIDVAIRPTPIAYATAGENTICSTTSADIVVNGNITDAAMQFSWEFENGTLPSGITSSASNGNSGNIAAGADYTINNTLTNSTSNPIDVTYTITPTSNGCTGTPITYTVTVGPNVTPGAIAADQTICEGGDPVAFTETIAATGSNLTYQWESSLDNSTYTAISGANSIIYNVPAGLTQNTWYRRVVSASVNTFMCSEIATDPILVTVNTFNPGTISGNQTICSGDNPVALGSVTPSSTNGAAFTYNWQSSESASGPWTDLGITTETFTPPSTTTTTFYQRVVTATLNGVSCDATSTNTIEINVNAVDGGEIASDQLLICGDNPAPFTSVTPGTGAGALTYQWQSSPSGANSWSPITNATNLTYNPPAGFTTATDYRRITISTLNGSVCTAESNTLTVTPNDLAAGIIASNRTVCFGDTPTPFTSTTDATASATVSYQWQVSTTASGPWTDISGATNNTYAPSAPTTTAARYYRRKAISNGCEAISNFVSVTVISLTPAVISGDQDICSTTNPEAFTVTTAATTSAGTLTYQWEFSTDNATWANIPTATSATYDPPMLTETTYYRVRSIGTLNSVACFQTSNTLIITVTPNVTAVASTTSTISDCSDTTIQLLANLEPGITGEWSVSPTTGVFSDITDPQATFTGDSGESYTITWTVMNTPCANNSASFTVSFPDCGTNFDFDGTDTSVSFGNNYNLNSNFSIEIWVKPNGSNGNQTVISKRDALNSATGYDLTLNSSTVTFNWNANGSISATGLSTTKWSHIAVTFDGTNYTLYIDGINKGTSSGSAPQTNSSNSLLGAIQTGSLPSNYYDGWVDELRIWDTALTENQIHEMMNQEIEANGTYVQGVVIPENINNNLGWTSLAAYYQFNLNTEIAGGMLSPTKGTAEGTLRNMTTQQEESAPIPYESNGSNWDSATSWVNGTVQQIPNTNSINWNIVRVNSNITTSRTTTVLGLIVNTNSTLTVSNNLPIEVTNYLSIDGTLKLAGESQLLQPEYSIVDYSAGGALHRDQQGTTNVYNYNYWASPVSTAGTTSDRTYTLSDVLHVGTTPVGWTSNHDGAPGNPPSISTRWLYLFENYNSDYFNWHRIDQNYNISVGLGYLMKGASNADYTFIGQPNNGDYLLPVNANNDALVGNPYPSAIDSWAFIDDNEVMLVDGEGNNGELRFWRQSTTNNTHITKQYLGGYATLNKSGSVAAVAPEDIAGVGNAGNELPGRYVPVAQSFFITAGSDGYIILNNGQRVFETEAGGNSNFLRTDTHKIETNDLQRVRIAFKNPDNAIRDLLLAFTPDNSATDNVDFGFDATSFESLASDLLFLINDKTYVIQGVGAFDDTKQYPLAMVMGKDGNVEISLKELENFDTDIDVFIYDSFTDIYTRINASKYQMHLEKGDYLDRYFLAFKDQNRLDVDDIQNELSEIKINYLDKTDELHIKTPNHVNIRQVYLINTLGQTVKAWNATNAPLSHNFKIPVQRISEGSYIVKVDTEKGSTTKKVIIKY